MKINEKTIKKSKNQDFNDFQYQLLLIELPVIGYCNTYSSIQSVLLNFRLPDQI